MDSLAFIYVPTPDVAASLRFYREVLGCDELWREGEDTVGISLPGAEVALMIDRATADGGGPGPMFMVPDVTRFLADHPDLTPVAPPAEIPGGMLASFLDPGGNWFYLLDQHADG